MTDTVHTKYYYHHLQLLTCTSHIASSIKAHSHYPSIHLSMYLLLPVLILYLRTFISCQRHSFAPLFITFIPLSFTFIYSFICFFFFSYSFFFYFSFLLSHLFLIHDILTTILLLTMFSLNLHTAHRVSRDSLEDIFTVILPPPSSSP